MIHYIKGSLLLIIYLIIPIYNYGQTIEELFQEATNNNLELKTLEKEYEAALEKAPQVGQLPDPEVSLSAFPLPIETRLGPQILRIGATQMLPWKGLLDGKKELELAKAKPLYERIAARQLDLNYQIKAAYFELYEIQQRQTIIQRNLTILEALDQLALSKVESGKTTAADVLRVQLKKEELQHELSILKTAEAKPTTIINQLLNRDLKTPIIIQDKLDFAQILYNLDTLTANIRNNHPMLRMYELQQDIARKAMDLNKLDSKPDFGVGLDYIMTNRLANSNFKNNGRDVIIPKVSIKIPLYKGKYEAKEREETLKIEALEHQKANLLSQFVALIDQALTDYEVARKKVELYEKQKAITQSAINILEGAYSASGSNFDELLNLEKELINYDLKILGAIVQSYQAKNNLERFFVAQASSLRRK